jgi:tetratricopeptide (TPR) repeat protein
MKKFLHIGPALLAVALLSVTGCSTADRGQPKAEVSPAADPVQVMDEGLLAAEAASLRQDIYQLKTGLAALQLDLTTLSNRLNQSGPVPVPPAENKVRLEQLRADFAREQANLLEQVAGLTRQLEAVRAAAQGGAKPDGSAKVAEREQQARAAALAEEARLQNEIAALRKKLGEMESRAGDPKELAALQKELAAARRQSERERAIAEEREKQLKSLRDAMDARPQQPAPSAPVVTEAEAAESHPADAPSPAPAVVEPTPAPAPVVEDSPEKPRASEGRSKKEKLTPIQQVAAANVALQQGNLARAMTLFRAALAEDDSLVGARIGLAACAYSMDDVVTARTRLQEVLESDPENVQALGLRGILNWKEGFLSEADEDSARAVAGSPNDAQLRNYRGIILHGLGRPGEAVAEMRKALELDPSHAEAMLNLAILLATGPEARLEEANTWYEKALAAGAARDEGLDRLLLNQGAAP